MHTSHTTIRARRTAVSAALAVVVALFATLLNPGGAQAAPVVPTRNVPLVQPRIAVPRTPTEVSFANAVASLLNAERSAHHLKPVTMRTQLISSARSHNLVMARTDTMSHQVRGEQSLGARLTAAGYSWSWAGENIGWNSDMSAAGVLMLQKAMYNERPPYDGHRLNILSSHFTNVGVDVYLDATHQKVWLTVDFGRP